ncbi:MAG: hypothetical protein EOO02_13195 [Chitinophagaceae bacterium]|nr:MAG: hypothetical protein EOO02_13195 [Chitinophagaceae bacterium]
MRVIALLLFFTPAIVFSQDAFHITVFGGAANYSGDLQPKRFTLDQAKGAFGLGLRYEVSSHLALRGGLNYANVGADDKKSTDSFRIKRNLNFQTRILEANLMLEYTILDLDYHKFSPYIFAGVSAYQFNPYTYDTAGARIDLRPLGTEGQGLNQYPGRVPYKQRQIAVPFGGGVKLRVTDKVVLAYEIGLRKLFTDYLDDVSATYVDRNQLQALRGPVAVAMAYRGGELKNGSTAYPATGTIRGGSKYKDWYYFHGISVIIGIGGNRPNLKKSDGSGRGSVECPVL